MIGYVPADPVNVHPAEQRAAVLFRHANAGGASTRHVIFALMLACLASALVVAENLVSNWDEGSLLTAWVVFCGALFAVAALYADVLMAGARRIGAMYQAGAQRRAAARADARFLATAQSDPRIMQELRAAILRSKAEDEATEVAPAVGLLSRMGGLHETPSLYVALSRVQSGHYH
jgi:hypothetical protein